MPWWRNGVSVKISRSVWGFATFAALLATGACSQGESGSSSDESVDSLSSALVDCSGAPQWASGTYSGGARVKNQNKLYECKQFPYSGWCGNPGYQPGVSPTWQDAWILIDSCNSGTGGSGGGGTGGSPSVPGPTVTGYCPGNPAACCPTGYSSVVLNDSSNTYQTATAGKCVVALGGNDTIAVQGGNSIVLGGSDSDNIQAANGNNHVVGGRSVDIIHTGVGNDTAYIFDLCEVQSGEQIDLGSGNDTIVSPVSRAELIARGVNIANVENVIVQQNSCKSECVTQPDCNGHGVCAEGAAPGQVKCQCTPPFAGEHCEIRPEVVPQIPANTPNVPGSTPGDENCNPALDVVKNANGQASGTAKPTGSLQTNPQLPGCRLEAQFCDENEVPLVPQPAFPINASSVKTSCSTVADPPQKCSIDIGTLGGVCTADSQCNTADGELCVPCQGASSCSAPGQKRCGKPYASCFGVKAEPFDPRANNGQGRGCIELRECADPQVIGTINQPNNLPVRKTEPDPTPGTRLPDALYTQEALSKNNRCSLTIHAPANYKPDAQAGKPDGGDKTWGVNFGTNVQHSASTQTLPFGIEAFDVLGSASFKAEAILYKKAVNIVSLDARAQGTQCFASGRLALEVGPNNMFGPAPRTFDTDANARKQCEDAIAAYTSEAGKVLKAKQAKMDALMVVDHFKKFGPTTSTCIARKRVFDNCEASNTCGGPCAASIDDTNMFVQAYANAVAELDAAKQELTNYLSSVKGNIQPLTLPSTSDSITFSVPVPPIPIGPFSLKIEIGGTGGWAVQPSVGLDYQALPPAVNAKATVTPQAFLSAYAQATLGIDIGIASVDVGVRATLSLFDAKAPLSAEMGVKLTYQEDKRNTPFTELLEPRKLSNWGYDGAFRAKLTVSMLDGDIDLIARARFLFHTETYKKRIAHWKGFSITPFEFVSKVDPGAPNGESLPLTVGKSFGISGDSFLLPKINAVTPADAQASNPDAVLGWEFGCSPVVP